MRFKLHSSRIGTAVLVMLLVVGLTVPLFVAADSKEANEPNDVQEAATPIEGTSIDGELSQPGGVDWYSKEFSEGDTVSFALTKPLWDQGLELSLHAPDGTELDNSSAYRGVEKTELSATASQSGEYALKIESVAEEIYGMQYTVHAPASEAPAKEQPELESGTQQENESNDNRSKAQPITHEKITGEISDTDGSDWYTLSVKKDQEVTILFTKEVKEDIKMVNEIYPPGGYSTSEKSDHIVIDKRDTRSQAVITSEENGSIDIGITELFGNSGEYEIQIAKTQQSDSSSDSEDATATTESDSSETQTDDTVTQSPDTDTTDASTDDDEDGSTSQFGPGFTGPAALVALFVTALFAVRRRGS